MRLRAMGAIVLCISGLLWAEKSPSSGGLINPEKAKSLLASDKTAILLDVRTQTEFDDGHIPGAILLPFDEIDAKTAAAEIPTKSTVIIVYCRSGRRSALAATTLRELGYKTVRDLGGIIDWPYETVKQSK